MRENLTFTGIEESEGESEETLCNTLYELFSEDMVIDTSSLVIVTCHRLSRGGRRSGPRDVIARFATLRDKKLFLYAASKLKGRENPIYINEQFPKEIEQQRHILRPVLKLAKSLKKKAHFVQEKLIIEGKPYTVANLEDIPFNTSSLGTQITDKHVLFSGRFSPFSNFLQRRPFYHSR